MRWPVEIALAERHLRRFLTLGHVLNEELRERWDGTDLGPSRRRARATGRAFLRARQGDPRAELSEEHALCFLPLPWSAELAIRFAAKGRTRLGTWLVDRVGPAPDLADLCEAELARIRARHVDNLVALGERRLVTADPAEACRLAERALALEPFDPRGHRLALAAAMRARNPQRMVEVRARVLDSLRQLGVGPDRATEILLRQTAVSS
ncbi:hypothetical protein V1227_14720 [Lentzea sp. DG1S-22]|uniref:hypothetical protein n=1 Tax=Lentzea sp. DG1S-22 TaxID=3108822 RepID=UPI002E77A6FC|nr:hypothetical protein [Lentzea sp. DG1S-22]WVH83946.1 hypothetical protein V1227_14720 [Lentzea sp. DG1S-22]